MRAAKPILDDILPVGGRIAVLAGNGVLPGITAEALVLAGHAPLVIMIDGEAESELKKYDHISIRVTDLSGLFQHLRTFNVSALVMAGGVKGRPRVRDVRLSLSLLIRLPRIVKSMALGDDGLLRAVIGLIESRGVRVVGVHEIVPDIVVAEGTMTRKKPGGPDWNNINSAAAASRLLGKIDVGQGAVAVGGRVVALEGAEGTAGMLARVADLRKAGRISRKKAGVLVKCSKPGQELRADMPAVGPETISQAKAAGLSGIALEANRTIALDLNSTLAQADKLGLFVIGFDPDQASR